MGEASDFLANLAMVLGVAALTTVLFHRLHQPVVLGYMLAGLIIGPHIPLPLVADERTIHVLSQLGVVLLMFSLGLEFSLTKLIRVAPTAGIIAVIQSSLMVWLGYLAGIGLGWTPLESFYTGAVVAISSTTIIVKAFAEQHITGTASELVLGVLIVEDLIAIVLLAVLTAVSSGAGLSAGDIAWTIFRLAGFLVALVVLGLAIVPPLFRLIVRLDHAEMIVVASVGFCFSVALLAEWFGYSVALGAFMAGALVAESGVQMRVEQLVAPVRDIFAAIFFVAVGMLIDPGLIQQNWIAVAALTAVVVLGKIASVSLAAFFTGFGVRTSVAAGMSLAQIGEFSFIIAGVGLALGATRDFLYPVAVAVSALTTLLTPWLIARADRFSAYVDGRLPKRLQSFTALYGAWLEGLRGSLESQSLVHRMRRLVIWMLIDAACLCGVIINAALFLGKLTDLVQVQTTSTLSGAKVVVVVAAALVSLMFCLGIVRRSKSLGVLLANQALGNVDEGSLDRALAPRRALTFALQFGLLLVVIAPVMAICQPFLPTREGAILAISLLGIVGIGFWRTTADLQGHVRAGSQVVAELLSRHAQSSRATDEPLAVVEKVLPGFGLPVAVRLEGASPAVGKNLVQLNLRGMTGATVIAIARGDNGFLPTGKEVLQPGDVLALSGTREATSAARQLLAPSTDRNPRG